MSSQNFKDFLFPGDRLKNVIECQLETGAQPDSVGSHLLVIGHGDEHDEQGGVLLVSAEKGRTAVIKSSAVTSSFRVTVAQKAAGNDGPHSIFVMTMQTSRSVLKVTCKDSSAIQATAAELRLLAVIANENRWQDDNSHSWLRLYDSLGSDGPSNVPALSTRKLGGWFWNQEIVDSGGSIMTTESFNPLRSDFPRTEWLREKLFSRQDEFSHRQPFNVRLVTYNVNDLLPREEDDLRGVMGSEQDDSDIIVMGLQEVDLSYQSLIVAAGSERDDAWIAAFFKALGDRAPGYELLCKNKFVGVMQIVLVKKTLRQYVTDLATSEKPIGLMRIMGNKAGVAARFKVHDSVFCFVTAHLAAFAEANDKRREDYEGLMRGLSFQPGSNIRPEFEELGDKPALPADSHFLFFLGDLNFRIALPDEVVHALVEKNDWRAMLEHDQLRAQIAHGKAFAGFKEGEIDFRPSFKYKHGTLEIDKKRGAAYTDRIVWRTRRKGDEVKSTSYTSHPEVLLSDHLPVSAATTMAVRVVDEDRRAALFAEVQQELENLKKEYTPVLAVDPAPVQMGEVQPRQLREHSITLNNSGSVPASFTTKMASDAQIYWTSPPRGVIPPNECRNIKLNLLVTDRHVDGLNQGKKTLNDTLTIEVLDGVSKDVPVVAQHRPSAFGASLEWLCRLRGSARDAQLIADGTTPLTSPREIWRIIELLMRDGKDEPGIFTDTGDESLQSRLREAIDLNETLEGIMSEPRSIFSLADLLVQFLEALAEPVIPVQQSQACLDAHTRDEAYACLDLLPHVHTNVLISITALLRFLLEGQSAGRLDDFAAIFGSCLFRSVTGPTASPGEVTARRRFVKLLIDL